MTYLGPLDVSHLKFKDGRMQKSLLCPYIFDLIHAKYDYISLFVLGNAIFISEFIHLGKSVSSEDINPEFIHQSNEIVVLYSAKCSESMISNI